jgi:hypothetical protein
MYFGRGVDMEGDPWLDLCGVYLRVCVHDPHALFQWVCYLAQHSSLFHKFGSYRHALLLEVTRKVDSSII